MPHVTTSGTRVGAVILTLALSLGACGTEATPQPSTGSPAAVVSAPTVPAGYALPFAAGTSVTIGTFGIHAGNFSSVDGGSNGVIRIADQTTTPASLDLLVGAGTQVHPVAAGTVLSAWTTCDVVVIDDGDGSWSEYIHLAVSATVGEHVTTDSVIGTVLDQRPADWTPPPTCGSLENGPPHVHLAFATGSAGSGKYRALAGTLLCGHAVDGIGDITGLGTVGGKAFDVPAGCGGAIAVTPPASAPPRPSIVPPPTPKPTPTPKPSQTPAKGAPPKPADTSYVFVSSKPGAYEGETDYVYRLTWTEPDGAATGFNVFLVYGCYISGVGQDCVRIGMHIPASDRTTIGTVAGTKRTFSVRYTVAGFEGFPPTAVLVSAFNQTGESKSAIAYTAVCTKDWWAATKCMSAPPG